MPNEASLYRVQGPSSVYYAVYVPETNALFTEANEKGARDHAAELGLTLGRERTVQHRELMRLAGRDAAPKPVPSREPVPVNFTKPEPHPKPIVSRLPAQTSVTPPTDVIRAQPLGTANPFASSTPLQSIDPAESKDTSTSNDVSTPIEESPSVALNRDVMSFSQIPRAGRKGNPFADHGKKK